VTTDARPPLAASPNGHPTSTDSIFAGIRWTSVGHVLGQLLRFCVSLVLVRLLAPEDFGLLGMAVVITGFVALFQTMGTHGAVIQRKELSATFTNSIATLNVALGATLTGALIATAPVVTAIYGRPDVTPIVQVLACTFLIYSVGSIHTSLLNRDMRFGRLVAIEVTTTIAQAAVAVTLAALGWRVWALVTGNIVAALMTTGLLSIASSWRVRWSFDWAEIRPILGFSFHLTGVNTIDYAVKNVDKLIIGSFLGPDALGYYWLAYSLCMLPADALTRILSRVLFPAFSRIQDDNAELRAAVQRTIGLTVLVVLPVMTGLAVVARPFVLTVIGAKWATIVPVVTILVSVGILQAIAGPLANVYLAKGHSQWLFRWNVASGALVIGSIVVGAGWGLTGVATAHAAVMVPLTALFLALPFRLIHLKVRELLAGLAPLAAATTIMSALVLVSRMLLEAAGCTPAQVLAIAVPIGAASYLVLIVALRPPAFADLMHIANWTGAPRRPRQAHEHQLAQTVSLPR
jgi:PST family polysaccharide transporter